MSTPIVVRRGNLDWWWCDVGDFPTSYGPFPNERAANAACVVLRIAMGEATPLDLAAAFAFLAKATTDDESGE